MYIFRRPRSKYFQYDFTVRGERFRGSTKETNETRAEGIAALKFTPAVRRGDPSKVSHPRFANMRRTFLSGSKPVVSQKIPDATTGMAGGC